MIHYGRFSKRELHVTVQYDDARQVSIDLPLQSVLENAGTFHSALWPHQQL